jgi:hypothetical protein
LKDPPTRTEVLAHAFIVRIQRAKRKEPESEWRGRIVHVPTQRTVSFAGLANVGCALTTMISEVDGN